MRSLNPSSVSTGPSVASIAGQIPPAAETSILAKRYHEAYDALCAAPYSALTQQTLGVCAMRAGLVDEAVKIFRGLCLKANTVLLRDEADDVLRINFATALTLSGLPSGGMEILQELRDGDCPAAKELRAAISCWAANLPFWQRMNWKLNSIDPANARVPLGFEAGVFPFAPAEQVAPPSPVGPPSASPGLAA